MVYNNLKSVTISTVVSRSNVDSERIFARGNSSVVEAASSGDYLKTSHVSKFIRYLLDSFLDGVRPALRELLATVFRSLHLLHNRFVGMSSLAINEHLQLWIHLPHWFKQFHNVVYALLVFFLSFVL